ncbi:hypothetical protein [uncultured Streptomyces sp.]|uniref:hypothetical protein n=1 Tax=uncultured Streptomyces sp. TaxID=174707 RepID=UPI0026381FA7|nr:hypothetical protein [uncultured Streptomyces sp.]
MGWTVLYIAFGIVALWLLGEVLLQYKARLRWRLLAFAGFLCVVLGVLIPSVPVIALGAITFAAGQTYVTLSFRKGFSTGWALGGNPGASRRRRATGPDGPARQEPTLEVSDLEVSDPGAGPAGPEFPERPDGPPVSVYAPEPLPDETGQYGVYRDSPYASPYDSAGHGGYGDGRDQPAHAGYEDPYADRSGAVPADSYGGGAYGYGDQQSYASYSDPYIGPGTPAAAYPDSDGYHGGHGGGPSEGPYAGHDSWSGQHQYAPDPYAAPQYGETPYGSETPPGGVWVPQQREAEQYPQPPQEEPAPYGNGYDPGYDGQYRY